MPAAGTNKWEDLLGIDADSKAAELLQASFDERIEVNDAVEEVHVTLEDVNKAARENLNFLAALAMPVIFQFFFPKLLLLAWDLMTQAVNKVRDFTQLVLGIPRGFGKTTLIKLFILYCVLFTQRKFILVISSTAGLAENIIADVVDMLNESNIVRCFGSWKIGIEKDTQDTKKFVFKGRPVILAAIGAEGSLRGLNLKNERPDVMIFEDVQTRECADSKVQSDSLERWMVGTAMKAKSPHGCFFLFVGNMYPTPYSILRKLKNNPKWTKFICGGILADGTSLWEELQPIKQLEAELDNDIAMGHEEIFAAEVLNDEHAAVHNRVNLTALETWPYDKNVDAPQGKFIIIDPATKKVNADFVTISGFEVYDGTPAIRWIKEGKYSPGETIKYALHMAITNNISLIGVESTAYQSTLLYWFDFICKQIGISGIEFVELHTRGFSKNARITNAIKSISAGELRIHPDARGQVKSQMSGWNPIKRENVDGILDTLAYAPQMIEQYGHLMTVEGQIVSQEFEDSQVVDDNCSFTAVTM